MCYNLSAKSVKALNPMIGADKSHRFIERVALCVVEPPGAA
jgi:hypothetical protein